ncbi:MAG: Uma2 family endonuclease [Micropepsaceae bacterium]
MNLPQFLTGTYTTAEYDRLARSGAFGRARTELRRGKIVTMGAQYVPHANVKRLLAEAIDDALRVGSLSWTVFQRVSVEFSPSFEPQPDIVVWDTTLVPADLDGPVPAAAVRLVVEISDSTLSDDLDEKLTDYAASGLAEYWVADVKGKVLFRHKGPGTEGCAERVTSRFGETFESLAYPTLKIDTKALA